MNYIVLDLEWNQGNEKVEKQRKDVPFEIIEIGAVKMNDRLEICRRSAAGESGRPDRPLTDGAFVENDAFAEYDVFHEIVRPRIYHEMHRATRDILHLDMEDLREGSTFPEVMERFLAWCGTPPGAPASSGKDAPGAGMGGWGMCPPGENVCEVHACEAGNSTLRLPEERPSGDWMFATWAPQDLTELQRNMRYYRMPPLGSNPVKFYDVQKLFSIAFEDGKSRRSLKYAVEFLKLPRENAFHRALSDAFYAAQILEKIREPQILQKVSFDSFRIPQSRKEEVHIVFDDYAKYISREFEDKEKLFRDREVASTKCYLCHRNLRKKVKWFTPNGKHYYSISCCSEHGYMKGKIRVRKTENGGVYAVKTLKFISEEEAEEILRKKEKHMASS